MERVALKIDFSTFHAEALEKMNEMFNRHNPRRRVEPVIGWQRYWVNVPG